MVTTSLKAGQLATWLDHLKTLGPGFNPATKVVLLEGFSIAPEPETSVQNPVPLVITLPES